MQLTVRAGVIGASLLTLIFVVGCAMPSTEPSATGSFCKLYEPTPDCDTLPCTRNNATWLCECVPAKAPEGLCDDEPEK